MTTPEPLRVRLLSRNAKDLNATYPELDESPFERGTLPGGAVHWIRPELVAEIGFTEWTADAQLRHPRFIGLRRDKDPRDVVREDRRRAS